MGKETQDRTVIACLEKAVDFLRGKQLADGLFPTLASSDMDLADPYEISSVYIPTYIVHSLSATTALAPVKEIIQKALSFLVNEREQGGVWRFFGKAYEYPPPDFDDTCCALAALAINSTSVPNDVFQLLSRQKSESGLYYTWIDVEMNDRGFRHTDGAVNANILFYSGLCGRPMPDVVEYLNGMVAAQEYKSLTIYGLSEYPAIYLITRAYHDARVTGLRDSMPRIADYLLQQREGDGSWDGELETALATLSLLNSGLYAEEIVASVKYVIETQLENGSWPARTFFQDFTPTYYGAAELTTALSIEVLSRFLQCSG